jgi:hypothetical protein
MRHSFFRTKCDYISRRKNLVNLSNQKQSTKLPPEVELLIYCAHPQRDATRAEKIRLLVMSGINWEYLIRLGRQHALTSLLYWNLNTTCPESVPGDILHLLERRFNINDFRNRFLTKELVRLLSLFKAHKILAVPYKGPDLASRAYGNVSLREFRDLDILIPKRDVSQAKNLLFAHEYRLRDLSAAQAQEAAYLREDYEYRFVLNDDQLNAGNDRGFFFRVVVGLHWRVTPPNLPFPFKAMRVWEHLEEVPLAGSTILSLATEDLLLLLCLHGTKHRWERLAWICDIAALVSTHQGIDWEWTVKQATKLGGARMLFLGLGLAHSLLDTDIPQNVLRRIQTDIAIQSLLAEVNQHLFLSDTNDQNEDSEEALIHLLRARERFLDRIKAYRHIGHHYRWMTPYAIDQAVLQLPPPLNILCYIFWPLRFVIKYVMSPARHFLRGISDT